MSDKKATGQAPKVTVAESTPWKTVPAGATLWQVHRQEGHKGERCLWYNAATGQAEREWAIDALTPALIQERWGAGVYRIQWMGEKDNKAVSFGKSAPFQFDGIQRYPCYPNPPKQRVEVVAEAAPVAVRPNAFEQFGQVYGLIGGTYEKVFALQAQSFAAEAERQRQHHQQMIELTRGAGQEKLERALLLLTTELRGMKERLDDLEEDKGEAGPGSTVVEAGGVKLAVSEKLAKSLATLLDKFGERTIQGVVDKYLGGGPGGDP